MDPDDLIEGLEDVLPIGAIGSNAYGLDQRRATTAGASCSATRTFRGTVPSASIRPISRSRQVNVSGASLYGVPLVLIGHTDNLAWSHTVSTAFRFTPFQETLNPVDRPSTYTTATFRDMNEDEVTVMVNDGNGNLEPRSRTIYSTHHGPLFDNLVGVLLPGRRPRRSRWATSTPPTSAT